MKYIKFCIILYNNVKFNIFKEKIFFNFKKIY